MSLPLSLEQQSFFGASPTVPVVAPNVVLAYRLTGPLRLGALRAAIHAVLERHDGLRFRLVTDGSTTRQRIGDPDDRAIHPVPAEPAGVWAHMTGERSKPLDLYGDGPLRCRLHHTGPDDHILTMTIHPAALDAWGVGIVRRELRALYRGLARGGEVSLGARPRAFTDYVDRQHAAGADLTGAQRDFFLGQFAAIGRTSLPEPRQARPAALVAHRPFVLDAETVTGIATAAREIGVTAAAVYLASFELALGLVARTETGGLSCVYLGREDPATQLMAAATARRIPLRFEMAPEDRVADFIRQAMRTWAIAVGNSRPPYSPARLLRCAGGALCALEPVFNLRVPPPEPGQEAAATAQPGHEPGTGPDLEWITEPNPGAQPMWAQFGAAALFAVVDLGRSASVTAMYDPAEVPTATASAIFTGYEHVLRTIAGARTDLTVGALDRTGPRRQEHPDSRERTRR